MPSTCLILLLSGLALGLASCSHGGSREPVEEPGSGGWVRHQAGNAFSFEAPPDLKAQPAAGIDSLVGQYRSAALDLTFDHGWYSDPLEYETRPGYSSSEVEIGGKAARLVFYRDQGEGQAEVHVSGVHFPDLGDGQNKLTLVIRYADPAQREVAERILKSVAFP